MDVNYNEFESCECVGMFDDEYVYDIELDDDSKIFFANDILIHNSIVLTIEPILQKNNEPFLIDNKINPVVYNIADDIKKQIDVGINDWARNELNSLSPSYEFKRENISSHGAFLEKKHYILNIRDDEGMPVDKFKYTGVEVVKTSTPKKLKPFIKEIIEKTIKGAPKTDIDQLLKTLYGKFQTMSVEDISTTSSINGYEKYSMLSCDFKTGKGTPVHVKAAIYYNLLLKKMELDKKYESIRSGQKIKTFYTVTPNPYGIECMGFMGTFPEEFKELIKVDYDVMFEKKVLSPIYRFMDAIGVTVANPLKNETVDLLSILG